MGLIKILTIVSVVLLPFNLGLAAAEKPNANIPISTMDGKIIVTRVAGYISLTTYDGSNNLIPEKSYDLISTENLRRAEEEFINEISALKKRQTLTNICAAALSGAASTSLLSFFFLKDEIFKTAQGALTATLAALVAGTFFYRKHLQGKIDNLHNQGDALKVLVESSYLYSGEFRLNMTTDEFFQKLANSNITLEHNPFSLLPPAL